MAKHNSQQLSDEFDRRLGRRSVRAGRANATRRPDLVARVTNPANIAKGAKGTSIRAKSGAVKVPKETKEYYQTVFGGKKGKVKGSFKDTLNNVVDETIKDLQTRAFTEEAIMRAMEDPAPVPSEGGSPGLMERGIGVMQGIPGAGVFFGGKGSPLANFTEDVERRVEPETEGAPHWQGLMEDFSRSPAGRAMNVINRPFAAVHGGLNEALTEDYALREEGNQQNNPLRFLDDLGRGAWEGLSGKTQVGPGDWWRNMRENSDIVGAESLRELDESHPGITRWLDRGVGLAGELTLDPLNYVGLGAVPVLKRPGRATKFTSTTAKDEIAKIVDNVARDFYDETLQHHTGKYQPSSDALAEFSVQQAQDLLDKSILEVGGGTHAGHGKMGGEHYARSAANRVAASIRDMFFKPFNNKVDKAVKALDQGGNMPIRAWKTHMGQSPEFKQLVDDAWDAVEAAPNSTRQYDTVDQFIASLTASDIPLLKKTAANIHNSLDNELIKQVVDPIYTQTRELYYNTVAVRVGKRKIPLKVMGKAYASMKKAAPENFKRNVGDFAKAMSYEHSNPGRLSIISQAGRSVGADVFEKFHKNWMKVAKKVSPDESKLLYQALSDPNVVLPSHLEPILQEGRKALDEMFNLEHSMGARPDASSARQGGVMAEDYAPVFTKRGKPKTAKDFKAARKADINANGRANPNTGSAAAAKAAGLTPVTDFFEALLLRKLKSTRDIARATYFKDLVENYGSFAKPLSDAYLNKANLRRLSRDDLPQYMREIVDKQGVDYHLPKEYVEHFDQYKGLTEWNSAEAAPIIREYAKLTNVIKYFSTVPKAGFHVRNMIGDFFMGMLDSVPSRTYGEVFTKYLKNLDQGVNPSFRLTENLSLSFDQMKKLYDDYANSGFYETELPLGGSAPSAGQVVRNTAKKVGRGARKVSDTREDFGRFVHFVAAMRQEATSFAKRGMSQGDLISKAAESATWRVNHYKFDYGALTAMERKIKLLFPFYTFTRKAAPTLLQQMILNPKYLGVVSRFMEKNDGSAADAFNKYFLPDYVKDAGYAIFNDEPEPFYMTQDILPTSTLNNLDFSNSQELAQSIAKQVNPIAQILPELAANKELFSGSAANRERETLNIRTSGFPSIF